MTITLENEQDFERRLIEHERPLLAFLDHPSRIAMYVDSRMERDMRAGACAKEPETVDWLEREVRDGQVLYDVGACSGSYSLLGARLGAHVIAFEPSALNYRQLCRNAALNRADITALPVALGSRTALSTISLSSDLSGAAGHRIVGSEPITIGHSVMVWTLDGLLRVFPDLPRPTVMKIDTDGGETGVIAGALTTLASVHTLMIEVRSSSRDEIARLLTVAGLQERSDRRRIAPDTWNVEWSRCASRSTPPRPLRPCIPRRRSPIRCAPTAATVLWLTR